MKTVSFQNLSIEARAQVANVLQQNSIQHQGYEMSKKHSPAEIIRRRHLSIDQLNNDYNKRDPFDDNGRGTSLGLLNELRVYWCLKAYLSSHQEFVGIYRTERCDNLDKEGIDIVLNCFGKVIYIQVKSSFAPKRTHRYLNSNINVISIENRFSTARTKSLIIQFINAIEAEIKRKNYQAISYLKIFYSYLWTPCFLGVARLLLLGNKWDLSIGYTNTRTKGEFHGRR